MAIAAGAEANDSNRVEEAGQSEQVGRRAAIRTVVRAAHGLPLSAS